MGVVQLAVQIFLYSVIIAAIILMIPGLKPDIDFEPYTLDTRRPLEGNLAPNSILDKAELFSTFEALESIALRGDQVIAGITDKGSQIVTVTEGNKYKTIVKLSEKCEGYWDVFNCGRPLGLRFDNEGMLLVADAFLGIFKVDIHKGTAEKIIGIKSFNVNGKSIPSLPDDLDVDKNGMIYWSDASEIASLDIMTVEMLGQPSGRLIQYDPKTKTNTVLIDKLHFANGVQLSRNEDFVTIAETVRSRVWKYHLTGAKKGQKEILVDRLPGMPDNIRSNGKGGFYISLVIPALENSTFPLDSLGPMWIVRKLILRSQSLFLTLLSSLDFAMPHILFKHAQHYVKNLHPFMDVSKFPNKVIIVEVDESGNIIGSLQNTDEKMSLISQITIGEKYTYFGSPWAAQTWRLKTEYLN